MRDQTFSQLIQMSATRVCRFWTAGEGTARCSSSKLARLTSVMFSTDEAAVKLENANSKIEKTSKRRSCKATEMHRLEQYTFESCEFMYIEMESIVMQASRPILFDCSETMACAVHLNYCAFANSFFRQKCVNERLRRQFLPPSSWLRCVAFCGDGCVVRNVIAPFAIYYDWIQCEIASTFFLLFAIVFILCACATNVLSSKSVSWPDFVVCWITIASPSSLLNQQMKAI